MDQFIEAVKRHPCLWNTSNADYRDCDKKDKAWQAIVNLNLGLRGLNHIRSAKIEWKKLRDNHRDSIKRAKLKSNPNNRWRFAKTMEFLVPHMKTRDKYYDNPDYVDEDTDEYMEHSPATMYLQSYVNEEEQENHEQEESKTTVQMEIMARKRKSTNDFSNDTDKNCSSREHNALDTFFESMAGTTKTLPVYLQNRVKKAVLEVVCQAEEEMANQTAHNN